MSEQCSVLIVDDDTDLLRLIETLLREIGVTEVRRARNGKRAIADLSRNLDRTDLIISDWNMPQMTGLELLQAVRKHRPSLPFVMLTARSQADEVASAREAKVSGYMVKPFAPADFASKIGPLIKKIKADKGATAYV